MSNCTSPQCGAAPSNSAIITDASQVFDLAHGQLGCIQNLGTTPLAVKLGTGASSTDFNFVLPAGSANDDGTSPPIYINDYLGPVSVAAISGGVRCMAWERQVY